MVETMLTDYCRIIEENHNLNEELQHCNEVARENFNLIAQLEDEIREKNAGNTTSNANDPNADCQNEIEKLQAQLEERGKVIEELLIKINDRQQSDEPSAIENDVIHHKPVDLADASQKLRDTIKDLETISGDIEETFNKKDILLQKQQAQIDELTKQLESRPELSELIPDEESNSICMSKLKEMEEHNQILANQAVLLEEQLATLMDEHNKLMENNNDLIKSIIVCQTEICKYEFE